MRSKAKNLGLFAALLLCGAVTAKPLFAYQVSCGGSPLPASGVTITSVLGEPRPASVGVPDRFHGGSDIAQCDTPQTVQAIESGTVVATTACSDGFCLRIIGSNGHAFDYVHVDRTVSLNTFVVAGTTVGTMVSDHLHLNEIQKLGATNFRINPQRPGALAFSDVDQPAFVPTTIGAVTGQSIIPVEEGTATPFRYRGSAFYVKGSVDVFINARDGASRKGLYEVGVRPRTAGYLFSGQINLTFNNLHDNGGSAGEVQTLYYYRNSDSDTFIGTNKKINDNPAQQVQNGTWNTDLELPGTVQLCGNLTDYPQGHAREECVNVVIDRTAATITMSNAGGTVADGGATSTTTITIAATDSGGIYSIKLEGVSYSSTNYVSGVQTSAQNTFPDSGPLADGSYTATVTDLAGNQASAAFKVDTSNPDCTSTIYNQEKTAMTGVLLSTHTLALSCEDSGSGMDEVDVTNNGTSIGRSSFRSGSNRGISRSYTLDPGSNYAFTGKNRAGKSSSQAFTVTAGAMTQTLCVGAQCSTSPADQAPVPTTIKVIADASPLGQAVFCESVVLSGKTYCGTNIDGKMETGFTRGCSQGAGFSIQNTTDTQWPNNLLVTGQALNTTSVSPVGPPTVDPPGNSINGIFLVPQTGVDCPSPSSNSSPRQPGFWASLWNLVVGLVTLDAPKVKAAQKRLFAYVPGTASSAEGSEVHFSTGATVRYSFSPPTDIAVSTSTLAIYEWDGVDWTSATVRNQYIYQASSTSVIIATGTVDYTGTCALFFTYAAGDSSAPATTLSFQGSTFTFSNDLFVSTDVYVVLTATDPTVNGYLSGLATTYYRIDATSPTASYSVYSTSIPISLGVHVFQYYSRDWWGNDEPVKTSSFIVTAGAVMKTAGNHVVRDSLLAGFLGTGARLELESRAENSYTLNISSPDSTRLNAISNIGSWALGTQEPEARVDIGPGSTVALSLRNGNTAPSTTSVQAAFSYNGTEAQRHAVVTQHGASTADNSMDFILWNPGSGSTTTIGALPVVSMRAYSSAASFHVHPSTHTPDVELEVSDGVTIGGGVIHRREAGTHSSRRLKSNIRYMNAKDEERGLEDVLALKPARFRYKGREALHRGLIYEDTPASIHGQGEAVMIDDRVVNLELALKASLKKLTDLEKRLKELQTP